jgi:hypothetical protein
MKIYSSIRLGTRDAIGMMRIIAGRTLEIDEELCICFIDWQKALCGGTDLEEALDLSSDRILNE